MFGGFKKKIVSRWLLESEVRVLNKDNGFMNVQIQHPRYGIMVVHPLEEKGVPDSESRFDGFLGYIPKGSPHAYHR